MPHVSYKRSAIDVKGVVLYGRGPVVHDRTTCGARQASPALHPGSFGVGATRTAVSGRLLRLGVAMHGTSSRGEAEKKPAQVPQTAESRRGESEDGKVGLVRGVRPALGGHWTRAEEWSHPPQARGLHVGRQHVQDQEAQKVHARPTRATRHRRRGRRGCRCTIVCPMCGTRMRTLVRA